MSKPRVLLADDHTLVLDGFRKLLEEHCEIVGAVEDGRALLAAAERHQPDVITLDISMPQLNGIDAARRLRKLVPQAKLIFVTMHADQAYISEAFKSGASGYLLKRSAGSELVQAIHTVMNGNYYVTSLIAKDLVHSALEGDELLRSSVTRSLCVSARFYSWSPRVGRSRRLPRSSISPPKPWSSTNLTSWNNSIFIPPLN
jgi:DNA-binding NarL/FixJ family response regulator